MTRNSVLRILGMIVLAGLFTKHVSAQTSFYVHAGSREVISTTTSQSQAWTDGHLGAVKNSDGTYTFTAASGYSRAPLTSKGTLQNPVSLGTTSTPIQNLKGTYDYAAGGPLYKDPATGMLLMIYHAEQWKNGDSRNFYGTLGMAKSTDNGATWNDLGQIITPHISVTDATTTVEIGGGQYLINGEYFYVYNNEYDLNGVMLGLSASRAKVADVVAAAVQGTTTPWFKYNNGTWTEPGIGGNGSRISAINPGAWSGLSYNTYLGKYIGLWSYWDGTYGQQGTFKFFTSSDGINWDYMVVPNDDTSTTVYTSLLGTGNDPTQTDQSFYVYYVTGPWWNQASVVRRKITLYPTASTTQIYNTLNDFSGTQGYRQFSYLDSSNTPLVYNSTQNQWEGNESFLYIWPNGGHPGPTKDSVRSWQAPGYGSVTVLGHVADADSSCGDGVITKINKGTTNIWQHTVLNGDSNYDYEVSTPITASDTINFVINRGGNNYCDSTTFTGEILYTPDPNPDTIAPTVSITSPLNNAQVSRGTNVTIQATSTDNVGVSKVEFSVNGTLKCTDTTAPYSCVWQVPTPKGVVYTLNAKAYDAVGNTSSSTVKVTSK